MNEVFDFMKAALPWIAIGLFVAIFAVKNSVERSEDTAKNASVKKWFKLLTPMPSVIAFLVALLHYADGKTSSGTTWLILAIVFISFGILNNKADEKKKNS